jgi:hypothetical protein
MRAKFESEFGLQLRQVIAGRAAAAYLDCQPWQH